MDNKRKHAKAKRREARKEKQQERAENRAAVEAFKKFGPMLLLDHIERTKHLRGESLGIGPMIHGYKNSKGEWVEEVLS